MPRRPADPARSPRDGRRHAACRPLRQNLSFLAASGAPPVRSRVCAACSLASTPLAGHTFPAASRFPRPVGDAVVHTVYYVGRFFMAGTDVVAELAPASCALVLAGMPTSHPIYEPRSHASATSCLFTVRARRGANCLLGRDESRASLTLFAAVRREVIANDGEHALHSIYVEMVDAPRGVSVMVGYSVAGRRIYAAFRQCRINKILLKRLGEAPLRSLAHCTP